MFDVSLAYRLMRNRSASIKELALSAVRSGGVRFEQLWALRGVTMSVAPGSVLGVIGPNGAGKSTMLKVIARVLPPTRGRVVVRGTVAPLIELGAGFNPELTGQENIVLYGAILGRDPAVMRRRVDAIAEWSDLRDFMDVPIRSYSSGMLARLGFAVATDIAPGVLLIDEVLSVGDEAFRTRASRRMDKLIAGGAAVVLVTHAMDTVRTMAERAVWLDHGVVQAYGSAPSVVDAYLSATAMKDRVHA